MMRLILISAALLIQSNLFGGSANEEFRATWVVTWDLIDGGKSAEENKALARRILDNHRRANMNAVLWQARQNGTAYYRSSYEPWGYYAGHQDPGYDPLAYAVDQAHKRGLELHAWMNVFESRSDFEGTPTDKHPDWICRDRDGIPMASTFALSPGLEAVREYLIGVAMEIVRNYDIDGLHLDYIRWNEYTNSLQSRQFARLVEENRYFDGMITDEQIRELQENRAGRYLYDVEHPYSADIPDSIGGGGQFPSWEDWWRWSVTEFVQVLHDSIQAVKPWVRLSVAALGKYNWSGWQGYGTVYQDAALWFNEGYVDQLTPMHYHWKTGNEFYNVLKGSCPQCWEQWIEDGISDGRLYSVGPGSYVLADQNAWGNHPQIVRMSRTVPWVDGFQFFRYGTWAYYDYWEEAKRLFFPNRTKIRPTALIDTTRPRPPVLDVIAVDSLEYEIAVTPADTGESNLWFAVYRSEDDTVNTDNDHILDIVFTDSTFVLRDTFTGTQDFNGQYRYASTSLNRFWNESVLSNIATIDSIPSFPPVVVFSTPSEGDTVHVHTPVVSAFSKTMDITTLSDAVSFTPEVDIEQMTWSQEHRTVTIQLGEALEHATNYTFTIDQAALDVNGVPIDGNGDGVGGDPFQLHFTTEEEDITGPKITFSYPDFSSEMDTFDVQDVITIVFDELVDPATVNDSSVVLTRGATSVEKSFILTTVHNRSVLTVQPDWPFDPDRQYSIGLKQSISDTLGNAMTSGISISFRTLNRDYSEEILIDSFTFTGNWKQPSYSGSTKGIKAGTTFGSSGEVYLPASAPKKSAKLTYIWNDTASVRFIREYLSGGAPRNVQFDTTYILQCYLFGDLSHNKFRFCVDDNLPATAAGYHEVSPWITIDWVGWRLVEWHLSSDPVGSWIGNGILEGNLRIDSFQLTHVPGADTSGTVYFDDLRIVRKTPPLSTAGTGFEIPETFALFQNYPNPFNAVTRIPFDVPSQGRITVVVYDIVGRRVKVVADGEVSPGRHEAIWTGDTDSGIPAASGVYFYRLMYRGKMISTKRMLLLK